MASGGAAEEADGAGDAQSGPPLAEPAQAGEANWASAAEARAANARPQRAGRRPCLPACLQRRGLTWSWRRGLPGRAAAAQAACQGKGLAQTLLVLGRVAPWALATLARRPPRLRRPLRLPPLLPPLPPRLPPRPRRWRRCRRWRPRAQGVRRPTKATELLRGTARRRRLQRVLAGGRRQGARAPAQRRRSGLSAAPSRARRDAARRGRSRAQPRGPGWMLMRCRTPLQTALHQKRPAWKHLLQPRGPSPGPCMRRLNRGPAAGRRLVVGRMPPPVAQPCRKAVRQRSSVQGQRRGHARSAH